MNGNKRGGKAPPRVLDDPRIRGALSLALAEARGMAEASGHSPWDFALELQALGQVGAGHSQLRWLIAEGLVEHKLETSRTGAATRSFRHIKNLALPRKSCFVATELGYRTAMRLQGDQVNGNGEKPHWCAVRCELRFCGNLIKSFRVPADNQESLLRI